MAVIGAPHSSAAVGYVVPKRKGDGFTIPRKELFFRVGTVVLPECNSHTLMPPCVSRNATFSWGYLQLSSRRS